MKPKRLQFRLASLLLLAILLFSLAVPAQAFTPMSGEQVVIEEGEVIEDDLYVTANTITVKGTIQGDLVAFGSLIVISSSGVVEGDLLAAGQGVVIDGTVGDDARLAGMTLTVGPTGKIADDLVSAGYALELAEGSQVGGDVVAAASQVALNGTVDGKVMVAAGGLHLAGKIGGDVTAQVGGAQDTPPFTPGQFFPTSPGMPRVSPMAGGLTVASEAQIGGDLNYTSPQQAVVPTGAVAGQVTYAAPPPRPERAPVAPPTPADKALESGLGILRSLASLLLFGLVLMYFWPAPVKDGAQQLRLRWLPCLGWGLLTYVGALFLIFLILVAMVILAVVLGMVTLGDLAGLAVAVGIWLAFGVGLLFAILTGYISKLVVAQLLGWLIFSRLKPDLAESRFWPLATGILIFVLLAAIPILGGILNFAAILFGLGALFLIARTWRQARLAG